MFVAFREICFLTNDFQNLLYQAETCLYSTPVIFTVSTTTTMAFTVSTTTTMAFTVSTTTTMAFTVSTTTTVTFTVNPRRLWLSPLARRTTKMDFHRRCDSPCTRRLCFHR
ncbi:hypothetical protein JTE90_000643 [Oedothorax gibbosus]|uniref:Uncharacterized protein n=1 Tax=Oedothorax gibbosus TaxID=931172 RepID=A0AAV6VWX6_9ARAC|nr:hypothetical protein JTE90_000643 [Oedothorax gibbosus]